MTSATTPADTALLRRQAEALLGAGRADEAIAAYRALLGTPTDRADDWYNLAWLERSTRAFPAALDSYARALALGVANPEAVRVNRAVILSEHLGRDAEAEAELCAAIAINRDFLAAWLNLGLLHEDRADRSGARSAYERAIELDPANGRAQARLAALDIFEGNASTSAARLRAMLRANTLATEDAAEIGFALGNALDAIGDYDGAFSAFSTANRTALSRIPPAARYDRAAQDRLIDELIRTFARNDRHVEKPGGDPPVFICGMFRSGSTLCERLLARHSRVTAGGEMETIPALVSRHLQPYPKMVAELPDRVLEDLRGEVLRQVQGRFPAADVVTDKLCVNFLHIGLIKTLFPEAKIVHTRRLALDNILSVFFLYFDDSISYGFALDDAVHYYQSYRRLMAHWQAHYGDDILDFDYDAVVRDPEPSMRRLLDFCVHEMEPACLAGQAAGGVVRTASAWQVRQPLNDRSSGRWRNYAAHIPDLIAALDGY